MSNLGITTNALTYPGFVRLARKLVLQRLSQLGSHVIEIDDAEGLHRLHSRGHLDEKCTDRHVAVRIKVHSSSFYTRVLMQGALGAAESYCRGECDCPDLEALFRVFARNRNQIATLDRNFAALSGLLERVFNLTRRNSLRGSQRNIAEHYDLSNDFFKLFLDQDMHYSSADFSNAACGLEQAQQNKLRNICERLSLKPGMQVLELGCGWGGFAVYAAKNYGCHVTAATISRAQFEYCLQRVKDAGLSHLVSVVLLDYREISGGFDRIVSIEMIEAVGEEYLDVYCQCLSSLLKPSGQALIQAITIEDYRYKDAVKRVDFIKKYIFPGSFIPSINRICQSVASTDLCLRHLNDLGPSYVQTLREWQLRFNNAEQHIRELGFDAYFQRMWNYYLSYCAAGFAEGAISVVQMLWVKPHARLSQV